MFLFLVSVSRAGLAGWALGGWLGPMGFRRLHKRRARLVVCLVLGLAGVRDSREQPVGRRMLAAGIDWLADGDLDRRGLDLAASRIG